MIFHDMIELDLKMNDSKQVSRYNFLKINKFSFELLSSY